MELPKLTPGQLKLLHAIKQGLERTDGERKPYYDTMNYTAVYVPGYKIAISQTRILELACTLKVIKFQYRSIFYEDILITYLGNQVLEENFAHSLQQ